MGDDRSRICLDHRERVLRRIVPEPPQLQIILGSLLGDARLEGRRGSRRLRIAHRLDRSDYVWWKYERLRVFADCAPARSGDRLGFHTVAHPIFDDVAPLFLGRYQHRDRIVRDLLTPLGLAVWLTDVGRLRLHADTFLPAQRDLALAA